MKKAETNSLLKQTNALGNYLDEMLNDATRLASEIANQAIKQPFEEPLKPLVILESLEYALLAEVAIEDVISDHQQVMALDVAQEFEVSNIIEITERSSVKIEPEVEVDLKGVSYRNKPSHRLDISQFPIQCLMFRVGQNLLSLPLIEMDGVVRWTDELTRLPQSPDWILGVLKYRDTNIRVLDSSKVLGIPAITGQMPSHLLLLSDKSSAISCDALEGVVTLEYSDIQWLPESGNALMHGIIRETLAYLLSPLGIISSLNIPSEQ
ncbi:MAG: chemotaxis signal transduction protein [Chitinophagales bacterium]|jgi:chemotaxis signal transduction protein